MSGRTTRGFSSHRLLFIGFLFAFLLGAVGSVIAAGQPVSVIHQNITVNVSIASGAINISNSGSPLNVTVYNINQVPLNVTLNISSGAPGNYGNPIGVIVNTSGTGPINVSVYNPSTGALNVTVYNINQVPLNVTLNISSGAPGALGNPIFVSGNYSPVGGTFALNVSLYTYPNYINATATGGTVNVTASGAVNSTGAGGTFNVTVSNAGSALNVTSAGGTVNVTVSNAGSALNVTGAGGTINVTVSNAGSALNVTSAGGTVNVTVSNAGSPLNVSEVGITGSVFNMTNPGYVIPDYSNLTAVRSTNMTSSSGIVSNFTWGGQTGLRNHLVAFSYSGNFTHLATGAPLIKITCTGSAGQTNTVWQKLWATGAPFAAESYEFNPIPLNCSAGQNMTFEIMNRTITGALTNAISAAEQAGGANFFFNIVGYSAP